METSLKSPNQHIGRKIARIREMLGVKQETLAEGLGISQQALSKLEQSEKLEEKRLQEVAKILGVPAKAIKNFNEERAITIISSTLHDQSGCVNHNPTFNFNPIDKIVELYDALLKEKDEKIRLFENFLKETRK